MLSVTPPTEYEACPYCFARLEPEPPAEPEEVEETAAAPEEVITEEHKTKAEESADSVLEKVKISGPTSILKRFRSLIPRPTPAQEEKKEKTEEKIEEPAEKPEVKEAPKPEPPAETKSGTSGCPHSFGYLAVRPPETPIPQECMLCPKIVDCMLKTEE